MSVSTREDGRDGTSSNFDLGLDGHVGDGDKELVL